MNTIKLLLFALLISVTLKAQTTEPYIIKDFGKQNINFVDVSTSGGTIKVTGGASTTRVRVYIRPNNWSKKLTESQIKERLENYILDVKVTDGKLICLAKPKNDGFIFNNDNRLSVSFEIESPEKVSTNLRTSGGSIQLANLKGDLEFKTSGGSLNLSNLAGKIDGKTSGGSIKLTDVKGTVSLSTSGGSITAENVSDKINLSTSGGSLTFINLSGDIKGTTSGGSIKADNIKGNLSISTSGGSIRFSEINGSIKASTSGGSINGDIKSIGEFVDLSTSAGAIRVDLPFNENMDLDLKGNRIYSEKLAKHSSTLKQGKAQGKINGGGKSVRMRTSSGSIYVD